MSKERELLRQSLIALEDAHLHCDKFQDEDARLSVINQIKELLAQSEQEPVTNEPTKTAGAAIMHNGVCVSNVYDAYQEGRKSVMVEQEPVAWKDRTCGNLHHVDWGNSIPLYTSPPKREPLSEEQIRGLDDDVSWFADSHTFSAVMRLIRSVEKAHGITGGEE